MPVELVLGLSPTKLPMKIIGGLLAFATKLLPGLLGYQSMFILRRAQGSGPSKASQL
jgi:hypothetical protein